MGVFCRTQRQDVQSGPMRDWCRNWATRTMSWLLGLLSWLLSGSSRVTLYTMAFTQQVCDGTGHLGLGSLWPQIPCLYFFARLYCFFFLLCCWAPWGIPEAGMATRTHTSRDLSPQCPAQTGLSVVLISHSREGSD